MQKLSDLNREQKATILMVTHDANVASYCSRILLFQDGVIFHQLRKGSGGIRQEFYDRIIAVMAQLGGKCQCSLRPSEKNAWEKQKRKRAAVCISYRFHCCILYYSVS